MQLAFGSGALWGERTDATGSSIGPQQFGILQDVQIDFGWTTKELFGQNQFAVAVARGQGKINGKAKLANIAARLYSDLFFGVTAAAGGYTVAQGELASVPGSGPYTVTVANAGAYADDLGVVVSTGASPAVALVRVPSAPSGAQYSVNKSTGVYTFGSGVAGAGVAISYLYATASGGLGLTLTNQLIGTTPTFKATFYNLNGASQISLRLNQCTSSKLALPTKLDDWQIAEFDFIAFADPSGNIGTLSTNQ